MWAHLDSTACAEAGMRLRKAVEAFWVAVAISYTAAAGELPTASYPVDSMGDMMPRWDEANHRVLSYQTQTSAGQVAVQITSIDRSEPTVKINVLKDFPGAVKAVVVGVTPGADRSIAVACRVLYPQRARASGLKELILTYDPAGKLIKIWDVAPYEPRALSSDERGNVYSLGIRFDAHPPADYPMLVEYTPDGKIAREMLAASSFPAGVDPTEWSTETGSPSLKVFQDRVYLYAAGSGDAFVLDRSGNILSRYAVRRFFRDLAARNHYAARSLIEAVFDGEGNLCFDVGLGEPLIKGIPNSARIGGKLNLGSLQSSQWPLSREVAGKEIVLDRRMIGLTADGSVVSLVRARGEFSVEMTGR
jgi:hypothetical protein